MKKLLIIGAIALVVAGCVLAAGCTSNTSTTTTEDFIVGTWSDGKVNYVLTNDFKGAEYTSLGTKVTDFTWKKTTDGKYELVNDTGVKVIVTLDKNKGIMTNADGAVLTKKLDGTSGYAVKYASDENGNAYQHRNLNFYVNLFELIFYE